MLKESVKSIIPIYLSITPQLITQCTKTKGVMRSYIYCEVLFFHFYSKT